VRFFAASIASLLLAGTVGGRACADEIRSSGMTLEPRISGGQDFQFGLRAGYGILSWVGREASVFLDGEVRPVPSAILIESSPTFTYRYLETRWSVGPGVAGALPVTESISILAALGISYSDAIFWGSNRAPEAGWHAWGDLGFRYRLSPATYWGAALQVRPLPELFPARITLFAGALFDPGPKKRSER